ncbi:MAG: YbjQ family protein [Chthonomonadales bacterium]
MAQGKAFTSDLSGQEFWLVVDKGYQPLGLVLGNCVYSMGVVSGFLAGFKGMARGEVDQYSRLMYEARELALTRMQAEADALGADGVVAVKLNIEYMHNNEWMEVTAIGTAVKYTGSHESKGTVVVNAG